MAKTTQKDEIKDEPRTEDRFNRILKRALTTPPKHKKARPTKADPAASSKKGQK